MFLSVALLLANCMRDVKARIGAGQQVLGYLYIGLCEGYRIGYGISEDGANRIKIMGSETGGSVIDGSTPVAYQGSYPG